jgi:plasmid stability protein
MMLWESMASILIRNIDEEVKARLRLRAARRGASMEAEARDILKRELLRPIEEKSLVEIAREIFGKDGVDLKIPPRRPVREPPDFRS